MLNLIVRRVLVAVPLILVVTFAVFVLIDQAPGDPATTLAGENPDPVRVAYLRAQLRLDDPVPVRWWHWLTRAVGGDLGQSLQSRQSVGDLISSRLAVTLSLVAVAFTIAAVVSLTMGIIGALRPRGIADRIVTLLCSIGLAVPPFWIAIVLVTTFAVTRNWFPAVGYEPLGNGWWPWLESLILPALALATFLTAEITLQLKAALTEVRGMHYVLAAEAKGLSPLAVLFKHTLKNAGVAVSTVSGERLAAMIGGTATVETVFGLRGIGDLAVSATLSRDVSVMIGVLLVTCIAVQAINLLVDISYGFLNPKART
jgi:peptide/nickel transport system permease protein